MQEHRAEVAALGVGIVAIGQGNGEDATEVCGELGVGFPCLGDPHKSSYHAGGLGRSGWWEITLQPLLEDPLLGLRRLRQANLRTNRCHIGIDVDRERGRIALLAALDSIGKGGAQAGVENMNLMLGLERTAGLGRLGLHP